MSDIFLTGDAGQSTNQPGAPSLPAIPSLDGTSQGMEAAVGALVHVTRQLAGQQPAQNSTARPGSPAGSNAPKSNISDPKSNKARWEELSRTNNTVKISNPDDTTQFVMVKQITKLVMKDNVTGEQWVWTL
jgi:hypothetical protein